MTTPSSHSALVVQSDAGRLPLGDSTVDLVVTSPPYFGLRSYTDGGEHYADQIGAEPTPGDYIDALLACTAEWLRVLKPTGSLWVNLGDKYARPGGVDRKPRSVPGTGDVGNRKAPRQPQRGVPGVKDKSLIGLPWRYALRCVDELELTLRAEVIWAKPNALPESVTDRVRRSHEQWFHFTAGPRYFADVDQLREPYAAASHERAGYGFDAAMRGRMQGSPDEKRDAATPGWQPSPLGKIPGSVWSVPSAALRGIPKSLGVKHFAAFPPEWPRRLIKGWCPPDGVVLDPFGGTGTTAMVARDLGRTGISADLSHDYSRLAAWRCAQAQPVLFVEGVA